MFEKLLKLLMKPKPQPTAPVPPPTPARSEPVARKINQAGLDLIKSSEGLELEAYPDPASALGAACTGKNLLGRSYRKLGPGWEKLGGEPWTIGYGHTGKMLNGEPVAAGTKTDLAGAEALLRLDVEKFEKGVESLVKVPLTDNQFAALVSFAYNCGLGNLGSSTLLKKVNAADHAGAAAEFGKWVKAQGKTLPGLVKRRAAERDLYLKP